MPEMLLEEVVEGETYIISAVRGPHRDRSALDSMGLARGREIEVVRNSKRLPFILEVAGTNYALSRAYAKRIYVCPADECLDNYSSPGECGVCREHRHRHHGGKD